MPPSPQAPLLKNHQMLKNVLNAKTSDQGDNITDCGTVDARKQVLQMCPGQRVRYIMCPGQG